MATSIETNRDLECPVCQEPFRTPKILPCGHTICLDPCLEQLGKGKTSVSCPECREVHDILTGGVQKFPRNILIIRLMEAEKQKKKQKITDLKRATCTSCQKETFLVNCLHCSCLVCEDCREAHTLEMRIDTRASLEQILGRVTEEEEADFHGNVKVKLDTKVKAMKDSLAVTFDLITAALLERRNTLEEEITKYSSDQEQIIDEHKQHLAQIKKLCETDIDDATKQSSMLEMTKQIEKSEEAASRCKQDLAHVDQVQLDISDTTLISSISGLGKLIKATDTTKSPPPDVRPKVVQPQAPKPMPSLKPRPSLRDRLSEIGTVKKCVGREGSGPGQLMNPTAVAVSPVTSNIIVADSGNYRLQVFDSNGGHLSIITCTVGKGKRFGNVNDLLVSDSGEIFTLDGDLVLIHSEEGVHINELTTLRVPFATSFALDAQHQLHVGCGLFGLAVYAMDSLYDGVWTEVTTYGKLSVVAIDARQVAIGDVIRVFSFKSSCTLSETVFGPKTKTYEYTFSFNIHTFNLNYQYLGCKTAEYSHQYALRISVQNASFTVHNGLYIISDANTHTVLIYDDELNVLKKFGSEGHSIQHLYGPRDVAVTLTGDVVVVGDNNFLQFF